MAPPARRGKQQRRRRRVGRARAPCGERRHRERGEFDPARRPRTIARHRQHRRSRIEFGRVGCRRTNFRRRDAAREQQRDDRAIAAVGRRVVRSRLHMALQRRVGIGRQVARLGLAVRPGEIARRPAGRVDRPHAGVDQMPAEPVDQLRIAHARRRAGRAGTVEFREEGRDVVGPERGERHALRTQVAQESLEHRDMLHDRARRERPAAGAGRGGFLPDAKRADGVVDPAIRVHLHFIAGRGDAGNRPDVRSAGTRRNGRVSARDACRRCRRCSSSGRRARAAA